MNEVFFPNCVMQFINVDLFSRMYFTLKNQKEKKPRETRIQHQ